MNKILIVDSEPFIIHSLKRCLRREPYQVFSALDVAGAVEIAVAEKPQMIIIDITVDHMKGRSFLKRVNRNAPHCMVIVLTALADREMSLHVVAEGLAKLYITKPWDNADLAARVKRMFAFHNEIGHEDALRVLEDNFDLVELPSVYTRVNTLIAEERGMDVIAREVEHDPALASKVLSLVNSAFYGVSVSSVERAVSYLGLNALESILLAVSLFDEDNFGSAGTFLMNDLREHSYQVNYLYTLLYQDFISRRIPEEYSVCALLHDIGKIIFVNIDPEKAQYCYSRGNTPDEMLELERTYFRIDHSRLGAAVLDWWNIPRPVVEAVLFHHNPFNNRGENPRAVMLLYLADAFDRRRMGEFLAGENGKRAAALFNMGPDAFTERLERILTGKERNN
ncbi:MAG: HDOD domain-containing protein [Fibrobacterota bacterium]